MDRSAGLTVIEGESATNRPPRVGIVAVSFSVPRSICLRYARGIAAGDIGYYESMGTPRSRDLHCRAIAGHSHRTTQRCMCAYTRNVRKPTCMYSDSIGELDRMGLAPNACVRAYHTRE